MDGGDCRRDIYVFADFELDAAAAILRRGGEVVPLTPTVFVLLLRLLERAGHLVTKDELMATVWAGRTVGESTLTQTMFTLRRALALAGAQTPLIRTEPGRGYRLIAPVSVARPSVSPALSTAEPPRASKPRLSMAPGIAVAGLTLCALAVAGALWAPGRPPKQPFGTIVQAKFDNLSGNPGFDRALERVVEVDFGQSPHFTVLSSRQAEETLVLMRQPRDALLTPALAREVCRRNNGAAVIEGQVARLGGGLLITLRATDCAEGRLLAAVKERAPDRDSVVPTLDRLIGVLRRRLGEARTSIRRFDTPLLPARTASLAALQAYSEGVREADGGRPEPAIALLEQAVRLDPNFAAAQLELARNAFNAERFAEALTAIDAAYAGRDSVNASLRYSIEILHLMMRDLDYAGALRLSRAATAVYPDHWVGWMQQANLATELGRYDEAVLAGRRTVGLRPDREAGYSVLAEALMRSGRLDEAEATCRAADAHAVSGGMIARIRAFLAIARRDRDRMDQVVAGSHGKAWESQILVIAALSAVQEGRMRDADVTFARAGALLPELGRKGYFEGWRALSLALAGRQREALAAVTPLPDNDGVFSLSLAYALMTLAETGQAARTRTMLAQFLSQRPNDTVLNGTLAPQVRAALDLRLGHPSQARAELAPAHLYERRDNAVPYLDGRIALALGDGAAAARAYHEIVDRPGLDPADPRHAFAWLGVARAERMQGNMQQSRAAYRYALSLWTRADADFAPMIEARRELAALSAGAQPVRVAS